MSNVSGSLIQTKRKAGSSSSFNTIAELFAECEPPTTALRKVCHGFRVKDETDRLSVKGCRTGEICFKWQREAIE